MGRNLFINILKLTQEAGTVEEILSHITCKVAGIDYR